MAKFAIALQSALMATQGVFNCGIMMLNAGGRYERNERMVHERVEINPQIMFGKSVISGTRITVEQIPRKLSGSKTIDEILTAYPHLVVEDIYAAVAFAADYLA